MYVPHEVQASVFWDIVITTGFNWTKGLCPSMNGNRSISRDAA